MLQETKTLPFLCLRVLICVMEAIKIESTHQALQGLKRATKCKVLRTVSDPDGELVRINYGHCSS